jgi:putative ABC transport system permease protein
VEAEEGVSQTELKSRVVAAVGKDYLVRTGKEDTAQNQKDFGQIIGYLTIGLLVFGVIALLVGAFVIFNTFTITVAQRTREFGMLRTIGASRKQVLRAVIAEALLIGVAGSILGLLAGLGLAPLLQALVETVGFELPSSGTVVAARTIVAALLVGTLVTLVSCLAPALRATRISPMAALREGAVGETKRKKRGRIAIEAAVAGLGVVVMLLGLLGGFDTSTALLMLGVGAVLVFIGVGLLSPLLVAPLAALIGRPLEATGGVAGKIARGNSVRSPGRTAGTAAALMIGVALVAFVSIFVSGLKASFSGAFEKAVTADFVVLDNSGLMPDGVAGAAAKVKGVGTAANLRVADAKLRSGKEIAVAGLDPKTATGVVKVDWEDGSDERLRALGPNDAMVEADFATEQKLKVGSPIVIESRDGRVDATVKGTYSDRGDLFGDVVLPDATVRDELGAKQVLAALISAAPGQETGEVLKRISAALKTEFPALEAQTREEFIDSQVGSVNQIVYLFYALLALSVLIALFGIVNTLALSVYERTRELGLLRAVGTSRRQVRKIVRGEAIITAVMGALLGVAIGVVFGVVITRPLEDEGFVLSIPIGTLLILVVLGALAGVLAAIAPARRASRIDVLKALTYE